MLLSNQHTFLPVTSGETVCVAAGLWFYALCRGLDDPRGVGLCLTDFRHAVDISQFPDDQLFVGIPSHSSGNLLDGQPWKWQLDYHGLMWCLLPLILTVQSDPGGSGVVNKNPHTGLFGLSVKPFK